MFSEQKKPHTTFMDQLVGNYFEMFYRNNVEESRICAKNIMEQVNRKFYTGLIFDKFVAVGRAKNYKEPHILNVFSDFLDKVETMNRWVVIDVHTLGGEYA